VALKALLILAAIGLFVVGLVFGAWLEEERTPPLASPFSS
jgi:hypothetical protein